MEDKYVNVTRQKCPCPPLKGEGGPLRISAMVVGFPQRV